MGLDVIFQKNGKDLSWDDSILEDFPVQSKTDLIPQYDNPDDPEQVTSDWEHTYIPHVDGMRVVGSVSFRGRWYNAFAQEVGLPHRFDRNLMPSEVQEQLKALETYLKDWVHAPEDTRTKLPTGIELDNVRALAKVLSWASKHALGTCAN